MEESLTKTEFLVSSDKQGQKHWVKNLKPWQPGQSGNPKGRPKGKTMKEYVREHFFSMTDEQKDAFLNDLPKELLWRMAEGNPSNATDITTKGQSISPEATKKAKEAITNFLNNK